MTISALPTTIAAGNTGHATFHNNTNTAINSIINRVQDAMTGATGAARFVGANAGAPASGTFLLGDYIWDSTAVGWRFCTVAGSPGTWSNPICPLTSTNPVALGTATPGTANAAAHADHVHPTTGLAVLSTYTTKGDIISATASAAVQRNAVGANGTLLVADSTQAGGIAWKTLATANIGPLTESVNTQATVTTTYTVPDVTVQTIHDLTLTGSTTLTFPTAAGGKSFTIRVKQGGTGSFTLTWPATVKWPGGAAPTLSTAVGAIDMLTFVCVDGTNWQGTVAGLAFA